MITHSNIANPAAFHLDLYILLKYQGVLAIRRIVSLVDMITNTIFSNCPNVIKIGVVWQ